jgi:hypothetical protein
MKKIIPLILIFTGYALSQSAGNSGLSFLKFGFGARNIAMGDAGSVISNDVTALYYNPARLAGNLDNEIMLMHNEWIQDVRSEILGVKTSIFSLPIALGFNITSVNDIEVRTRPGDPETTFNANFFFGSLSTGFFLTDDISFGLSVKYLYEGIYVDEAAGWGFDFGLNYLTKLDGLSVSGVIKNIGTMSKLKNEKTKLPTEIRFGPAYSFSFPEQKLTLVAAGEFLKYTPTNDTHFDLGGEVVYNKLIALRGGYQTGFISRGVTAGVGLMWGNLDFDYAISPFALDLGTGHSISLSFKF